jgi:alpha-glucosidase
LPLGGWPNWVLGNHDRPRVASRVGPAQARVAALLLLTLHGTPTIYNDDEIGLEQSRISPEQVRDPVELNVPGRAMGRDGCRTPMQWDDSPNAGFTTGEPWLPNQANYSQQNVVAQQSKSDSLFHFYRTLIMLRRRSRALTEGGLHSVRAENSVLVFDRAIQDDHITIALNLSDLPRTFRVPSDRTSLRLVLSSRPGRGGELLSGVITLEPNEGIILSA